LILTVVAKAIAVAAGVVAVSALMTSCGSGGSSYHSKSGKYALQQLLSERSRLANLKERDLPAEKGMSSDSGIGAYAENSLRSRIEDLSQEIDTDIELFQDPDLWEAVTGLKADGWARGAAVADTKRFSDEITDIGQDYDIADRQLSHLDSLRNSIRDSLDSVTNGDSVMPKSSIAGLEELDAQLQALQDFYTAGYIEPGSKGKLIVHHLPPEVANAVAKIGKFAYVSVETVSLDIEIEAALSTADARYDALDASRR
jgi:hypothetical protein